MQVGYGGTNGLFGLGLGLTGTSQVCLDSEHKGWKHAQIERQTFCHKNAASVVCGCFNAHTVLVLHADPFDSKHFNRQRTYGKNHTKSDDRYCLIWAGKPIQEGQGDFHSRRVLGGPWCRGRYFRVQAVLGCLSPAQGAQTKPSVFHTLHPQQEEGNIVASIWCYLPGF